MKLLLGSVVGLVGGIFSGRKLQHSEMMKKMNRKTMASLALCLATIDVVAIGGIVFGGLACILDANNPNELAMKLRTKLEVIGKVFKKEKAPSPT